LLLLLPLVLLLRLLPAQLPYLLWILQKVECPYIASSPSISSIATSSAPWSLGSSTCPVCASLACPPAVSIAHTASSLLPVSISISRVLPPSLHPCSPLPPASPASPPTPPLLLAR
jgi:hypothetical protein